jgi:hypothetical protein
MAKQNDALTLAGPVSRQLFKELLAALKPVGAFREEVKKTSVHLIRKSAFAGLHPRKEYLVLTVKAEKAIRSPRIFKAEQVSTNRCIWK